MLGGEVAGRGVGIWKDLTPPVQTLALDPAYTEHQAAGSVGSGESDHGGWGCM